MTVFTCIFLILAGSFPGFISPSTGIGDEILPLNPRSFGMGGICAGVPDSTSFSMLNPAASAWALNSGVCFGGRYSEGDVSSWDNSFGIPLISAVIPLPGRIVVTAAIDGKSRIKTAEEMIFDEFTGDLSWSGGLVESYTGLSVRATDWLAFSFGGRCTFGSIVSDVTLIPDNPSQYPTKEIIYRDDVSFRQAWGGVFGLFINSDRFGLGFSISTDRKGTLDIHRDYEEYDPDSSSQMYTIPGELSAGISYRPLERLLIGLDIYSRKSLDVFGSITDSGSIISAGSEVNIGSGVIARTGYSHMNGLWRDGADRFTAGAGLVFGDGKAGIDLSTGFQFWRNIQDEFQKETVLFISLWATEKWLGE
ncbi:MAG: hypothetical protein K8R76_08025 [Candidatus Aegiribacteria sp.]|nr:hypothetical protein [Candidatus Aegiribacteria sp.]